MENLRDRFNRGWSKTLSELRSDRRSVRADVEDIGSNNSAFTRSVEFGDPFASKPFARVGQNSVQPLLLSAAGVVSILRRSSCPRVSVLYYDGFTRK